MNERVNTSGKNILEKGRRAAYWVTAAVFIIAGAGLTSLPGIFKLFFKGEPVVATVNGLPISVAEYKEGVRRSHELLTLYKKHFGSYYKNIVIQYLGGIDDPEAMALEQLIGQKILLGLGNSIPLRLSAEYVRREISDPRVLQALLGEQAIGYLFTEQGILRADILRRFLSHRGLSMEFFEKLAEDYIAGQFALQLSDPASLVTDSAVLIDGLRNGSKRTFEVDSLKLGATRDALDIGAAEFTDEEIDRHFKTANRMYRTYWDPERRSATLWRFDLKFFTRDVGSESESEDTKKSSGDYAPEVVKSIFLKAADEALSAPRKQQWERFVADNNPVKTTISEMSQRSEDPLSSALFELGTVGERKAFVKKNQGYVVELSEIVPAQEIGFNQDLRLRVMQDLFIRREFDKAVELFKQGGLPKGSRRTTFTLEPGAQMSPESSEMLKELGLTPDALDFLLHVGSEKLGSNESTLLVYRIKLVDSARLAEKQSEASTQHKLLVENQQRTAMVLIASLRDHAILTNDIQKASST